jgi:HSP20 family protein
MHHRFHRPPVHISEKEDHFELLLFAPGIDKEAVNIRVKNDELFITYKAPKTAFEDDEIVTDFDQAEYPHRSFMRSFHLNNKVLIEEISADYTDGVLKLTLPKNPETNRPVHNVTVH